jgi:two-component system, LytTR family, sensor kinase
MEDWFNQHSGKLASMFEQFKHKLTPFWTLQFCGWGAFGFSMFMATLVWVPIGEAALIKGVFTSIGLFFSLPLRAINQHLYRRNLTLPKIIAVSAGCVYILGTLWTVCFHLTMEVISDWSRGLPFEIGKWSALFNGALYHVFVLLAWSALYFGIKYYRDLQAQTARALKAESLAHQAQLRALRYQLNPHFLFNTLNAISTLVAQNEGAAANRMIARLSEFLRLTLEGSNAQEVPLAAELDFVNRYLEIERVRLGDRLDVKLDASPDALSIPVPNLILQPLVENAIRHSIAPSESGGRLEIEARCVDGMLWLEVRDDGPNLTPDLSTLRQGVGLSNTLARLDQLYGSSHRFDMRITDAGGLAVVIGLPLGKRTGAKTSGNDYSGDDTAIDFKGDA